jgi:CDGSH-type Zn-finger protein
VFLGPGPAPGTTVASNTIVRNDDNISAQSTSETRILDNTLLDAVHYDGIYMSITTAENLIRGNFLRRNFEHDCHDDSVGTHTAGTANYWIANDGVTENKPGLCDGGHGDDDDDAENDEDGDNHDHVHWTHMGHGFDD